MLSNRRFAGARRCLGFALVLGAWAWNARPALAGGEEGEDSWSLSRAAQTSANDLRPVVELRFSNYSPAIDDTESVRIQVFRSGLLHYEQVRGFTRAEVCGAAYRFGLGTSTQPQLANLEAALRRARIGEQTGSCSLTPSDALPTQYRLRWVGPRGDRVTDISFESGHDPVLPPPPPPCDAKLAGARNAILLFAERVLALRTTKIATGGDCYPPL